MKKSILDDCLRDAKKRIYKHPEYDHFIHFSYVVVDNKIVSRGMNNSSEPNSIYGYKLSCRDEKFKAKTHSELMAIKKCKVNVKNSTVVNIRLSKKSTTRMSAPCKSCRKLLWVVGVQTCYFTHENGWGKINI